jgi:riboflavin synthase
MFTGIVEAVGDIVAVHTVARGIGLTVDAGCAAEDAAPGASICVNGVCLTVAAVNGSRLDFDVMTETCERSNLGRLQIGDRVNLERSLRLDGRLDGHFVQGHVDGTATIRDRRTSTGGPVIWFEPQPGLSPYVVPKGSVAVDGISLTIAEVRGGRFSTALIPTTIERTTLWDKPVGSTVNVETDILVRTIVHWLQQMQTQPGGPGLTLDKLVEHGFA